MPEIILTKQCSKCKEIKPLHLFSPAERGKYGARADCKKCNCKRVAEYHKTENGKASQKRYDQSIKGKAAAIRYRTVSKLRYPSHDRVGNCLRQAVYDGRIKKPSVCQKCNKQANRIEAHHYLGYDFKHRFKVQWLCVPCHRAVDS